MCVSVHAHANEERNVDKKRRAGNNPLKDF